MGRNCYALYDNKNCVDFLFPDRELIMESDNLDDINKFIGKIASLVNYGMYRYWENEKHDTTFYDCGDRTIFAVAVKEGDDD